MPRTLIAHQPVDIVKPLMAWFRGIAQRRALADMPAYLLKDIGLHRDELGDVAGYAVDAVPASAKVVRFAPRPTSAAAKPKGPLAA